MNARHTLRLSPVLLSLCIAASLCTAACGDDDTAIDTAVSDTDTSVGDTDDTADTSVVEPPRGCDPIAPSYCAFPYPNDHWTRKDVDTPTGLRLDLPDAIIPENSGGVRSNVGPFNVADGFSPAIAAMVHLPGATTAGLPTPDTIEASLADDAPIVFIRADTGERVPYWVDLDAYVVAAKTRLEAMEDPPSFTINRSLDSLRTEQALLIRPARRLADGTRYIVALRGIRDKSDALLGTSEAFSALRDDTPSDDPGVEARRGHFETLFTTLGQAGVQRGGLQLAWDYTTASKQSNTQWMVAARDDALGNFPDGVPYTVEVLTEGFGAETACRLEITFEMPLYMDKGEAGGVLNFGADGLPAQNGTFPYLAAMTIPMSARTAPAPLVEYGHGQLGAKEEVVSGTWRRVANELNLAMFALDFKGFAFDDVSALVTVLASGDLSGFRTVPERLHQSMVNFLLAMRTLWRATEGGPETAFHKVLANDCGGAMVDGSRRYWIGGSQGGILGATVMALNTDIERGVLAVPGQPYNLLLNRSVNFDDFAPFFYGPFDWNGLDAQLGLALIQGLWDRAEPSGYSPYIRTETFANTPSHEVLLLLSKSDKQVSNLAGHMMARSIGGVVNLAPTIRTVWGIPEVTGPHTGSAMLESDFGNPEAPLTNTPPWSDDGRDPHNRALEIGAMGTMMLEFLTTGTVENRCNGACDADDITE